MADLGISLDWIESGASNLIVEGIDLPPASRLAAARIGAEVVLGNDPANTDPCEPHGGNRGRLARGA